MQVQLIVQHINRFQPLEEVIHSETKIVYYIRRGIIIKTPRSRITNNGGKIILHLTYKLKTDYNGLSHRLGVLQTMGAIHIRHINLV